MDVNISWLSLHIHLRLLLVAYNLLQPDDISEGHRWIAGMEPFYDPGPWLAHQMVFPMGGLHCLDPCLHCASSTSVTLANFRMVVKYLRLWEGRLGGTSFVFKLNSFILRQLWLSKLPRPSWASSCGSHFATTLEYTQGRGERSYSSKHGWLDMELF